LLKISANSSETYYAPPLKPYEWWANKARTSEKAAKEHKGGEEDLKGNPITIWGSKKKVD
jgi:hypothetical protein